MGLICIKKARCNCIGCFDGFNHPSALSFDTYNDRQQHEMPNLADRRLAIATREGAMIGSRIFHFAGPTHISIGRLLSSFFQEDDNEL
jgi:hypothetical protein